MKKILAGCLIALVFGLVGCKTDLTHKQVKFKETVFGFKAATPGPNGASIGITFGLIRTDYFSNPTSTNGPIYAGQFSSHVDAGLSASQQAATEDWSTLPMTVKDSSDSTNHVSGIETTK